MTLSPPVQTLVVGVGGAPAQHVSCPARLMRAIHVFGQDHGGKVESSMMFDMLKVGTTGKAAYPGVVVRITRQPEMCDAEVSVENPAGMSTLHGSYDHITPTVQVGQQVATVIRRWNAAPAGYVSKYQCRDHRPR